MEAAPGVVDTLVAPDVQQSLVASMCGNNTCSGAIETASVCRSIGDWWLVVSPKCAAAGLGLLYFELGDLCGGGGRVAKYSCCPPGVNTTTLQPSSAGCPPTPTTWPIGSPCSGPLHCNYPDPCGTVIDWHCKGGWTPNSGCLCSKK